MKKDEIRTSKPKVKMLYLENVCFNDRDDDEYCSEVLKYTFRDEQNRKYFHYQVCPDSCKPHCRSKASLYLIRTGVRADWITHTIDFIPGYFSANVVDRDMRIYRTSDLRETKVNYLDVESINMRVSREFGENYFAKKLAELN